jgi:hypothetical protein
MSDLVLEFEQERATKNTIRFKEVVKDGEPAYVGTLYVQKHAAPSRSQRLRVTIAPLNGQDVSP